MTRTNLSMRNLKFNAAAVLCARLTVPALNVVLVVGITRAIGFTLLGQYTLLLTLVLLADAAKSAGLHNFVIREVARESPEAAQCYQSLIRIGLAGAALCAPVVLLVARFSSPHLVMPAAIMALALLPGCVITANESIFLAKGRAHITATITLIENVIRLSVSLVVVLWAGGGIMALAGIYSGARFLAAIMGLFAVRRFGDHIPSHNARMTLSMLRSAPEFAGVFVLPMVLFRLDVLLLGVIAGDYAVGVYSAAMRFISVIVLIPDSIMSATFALLSKLAGPGGDGEFNRLVDKTIQMLSNCLTPITIFLVLSAPVLLRVLFGGKSESAVLILEILAWSMTPFALTRAVGDSLVALGSQRAVAMAIGGSTVVSAILYVVLIRQYDTVGAAIGFFTSGIILLAMLTIYQSWAPRRVASPGQLLRALFPGVVSAGVFFAADGRIRTMSVVSSYVLATVFVNWRTTVGRVAPETER